MFGRRGSLATEVPCRLVPERSITLDEDAYEKLEAQRGPEESFSDVIHRLLGPGPPGLKAEDLDPDGGETMEDVAETAGDEDAELEGK